VSAARSPAKQVCHARRRAESPRGGPSSSIARSPCRLRPRRAAPRTSRARARRARHPTARAGRARGRAGSRRRARRRARARGGPPPRDTALRARRAHARRVERPSSRRCWCACSRCQPIVSSCARRRRPSDHPVRERACSSARVFLSRRR
jgi:hypothetical protein